MYTVTCGSAVKFEAIFYDFNDLKQDPNLLKFKILDSESNEVYNVTPTKKDVGEYVAYYTPTILKKLYSFEWYGEINGYPIVKRGAFTAVR